MGSVLCLLGVRQIAFGFHSWIVLILIMDKVLQKAFGELNSQVVCMGMLSAFTVLIALDTAILVATAYFIFLPPLYFLAPLPIHSNIDFFNHWQVFFRSCRFCGICFSLLVDSGIWSYLHVQKNKAGFDIPTPG